MSENINSIPIRIRRLNNDKFFDEGNKFCSRGKVSHISSPDEENTANNVREFQCKISGCWAVFTSLESYISHYNSLHKHTCCTCRRVFPSAFLLEIHVLEWHDSFFQTMANKHNSFRCLVQSCDEKFQDSKQRHKHVVSIHKFPYDFRFDRQPQNKSTALPINDATAMIVDEESSLTQNRKVPTSICFGSGSRRGFSRRRKPIES